MSAWFTLPVLLALLFTGGHLLLAVYAFWRRARLLRLAARRRSTLFWTRF